VLTTVVVVVLVVVVARLAGLVAATGVVGGEVAA